MKKKKVTLVIPMYYEEKVAEECYKRVKENLVKLENYEHEIIFVNDGSTDKTLEILEGIAKKDKNVKVLSFSRNFGHQAAVTAGLQYVTGDAIVIMDADLQDPPELIPDMLKLWEDGNEVIYGKRKSRKDFRLVDRKVVDTVNSLPEHNKFLRGLFSWVGYKQAAFEYERKERFAGETKYPLKKMLKLASDGIISFSTKPLKIVGALGMISIIVSILLLIYTLISFAFKLNNLSAGWTSIMVAITFFAGIQLMSIWIIAEYVGRIYDETKQRPQYIIDKKINISGGKKDE